MKGTESCSSEEDAFRAHYDENFADVWRFVRRRCVDAVDADDAAAETFAVAWRRRHDLPPDDKVRLWLFGVARHVLANKRRGDLRRDRLHRRLAAQPSQIVPDPFDANGGDDSAARRALAALAESDRELLILRAWDGLRVGEIAHLLGCSPNAASQRLRKARDRFAVALEADESTHTGIVRTSARREPELGGGPP